jgi:DNA-binding GntR family transcriptional regulator
VPATKPPQYRVIADAIRAKIADGDYAVEDKLPSTEDLRKLYGASARTVRRAIEELGAQGIVYGQPGVGVFVAREADPQERSPEYVELKGQIDSVREALQAAEGALSERLRELEQAIRSSRDPE